VPLPLETDACSLAGGATVNRSVREGLALRLLQCNIYIATHQERPYVHSPVVVPPGAARCHGGGTGAGFFFKGGGTPRMPHAAATGKGSLLWLMMQ